MQVREVFTLGAYLSNSLFQYVYGLVGETSGRDLDKEVLRQLGREEILAFLRENRPVDVDRLEEKYRASAYVLGEEEVVVEVGSRALALRPAADRERSRATATRGMVVFSDGRIRGPAVVIEPGKHTRDKLRIAAAMEPGSILVTGMTHPNIMVACEKAAAIVTDEGGVTCHAAIVARELQIPCVVGTQNATSIFSSGELLEVDSLEGWVRSVEA
jgi:phosphoenolpyruvate synthase/pyruvate phosphate dikinase